MPNKVAKPVTRKANETEAAYLKRLMTKLYGRSVDMKHPLDRDGKSRAPKSRVVE